jgi:hypothetical protein
MFKKIVLASFILATPAFAQQQPDASFLQRAINTLQTQRNTALDAQAVAEARASGFTEELAKANAKIKELEDKVNPPKEDKTKE